MNRFIFTTLLTLTLLILFVADLAAQGIFRLFDVFSLTICFLVVLLNLNSSRSFITVFFVFGFLVDWVNKSFLGVSSLLSILLLFVYNMIVRRFAGNKLSLAIVNFAAGYLLFLIWTNFQNLFSIPALVCSTICLLVTSFLWFK